jgi:hypothetical protein
MQTRSGSGSHRADAEPCAIRRAPRADRLGGVTKKVTAAEPQPEIQLWPCPRQPRMPTSARAYRLAPSMSASMTRCEILNECRRGSRRTAAEPCSDRQHPGPQKRATGDGQLQRPHSGSGSVTTPREQASSNSHATNELRAAWERCPSPVADFLDPRRARSLRKSHASSSRAERAFCRASSIGGVVRVARPPSHPAHPQPRARDTPRIWSSGRRDVYRIAARPLLAERTRQPVRVVV